MADISSLGNLQSSEPLDLPVYQGTRTAKPFPKAGRYTARTPDSFPPESFGKSRSDNLTVDVSPTIVGGEYDGYKVNFTKVSAKTWTNKDGHAESQLGRYLKACGINEVIGGDPQAQADAAERTANTLVSIDVDWVARNRAYNFELKGMKNFPSDGNGGYQRRVTVTDSNGQAVLDPITGEPVTAVAFLEVTRFLPATN